MTQLGALHLGILFLLGSVLGDICEHNRAALSRFEVLCARLLKQSLWPRAGKAVSIAYALRFDAAILTSSWHACYGRH